MNSLHIDLTKKCTNNQTRKWNKIKPPMSIFSPNQHTMIHLSHKKNKTFKIHKKIKFNGVYNYD